MPDHLGRRPFRAYLVPLDRDGEKIDVDRVDDDPLAGLFEKRYEVTIDGRDHLRIDRCAGQFPDSPPMWFVFVNDSRHTGRDTRSLVGFASDHFPDGTVINEMEFVLLPVANEEQVAAVQWSRSDGSIEQIYVAPHLRRSDVGRRMGQTAGACHQVHGWSGVAHASGRRTALGEAFATGAIAAVRVGPHTELSPPMDPST